MTVKGASIADGVLQIELERELPEAMKPRQIEIQTGKAVARAIKSEPSSIPRSHNTIQAISSLRWSA